ncbi:MAG: hypothetical protein SCJ97_10125 [Bacillota bacterium]|nr:hypothetical protein [Bacillota bacterium]
MKQGERERVLNFNFPHILEKFKQQPIYLLIGILLFLLIVGGVYSLILLRDKAAASPEDNSQQSALPEVADIAEVLPQQIRSNDTYSDENSAWKPAVPISDPFADPMKLTGTALGGRGGAMAIIESGGTSYIVSVGDYVDDLWAVNEITGNSVILRAHSQEVALYLGQPPETRSISGLYEPTVEDEEDAS